ncbi:gluconate 2-dehydrogenase subunit 3 family protein [Salicibibacter cibarius]|uniref:Gluconate 2-dehydrogenase subunit 3 family protein n=1 Tax=Salicibibacter cibarius TaxID=2743000 RepID=A0A7T6Z5I2_9BACI|nr:gluconate 2-dehydrogenase subunit 3 family protein [Salicibibacter cibarius]QQK77281.1 gluconate 2-dehydrogenase subunit 3 family protein [Salicibibacter cibarius]
MAENNTNPENQNNEGNPKEGISRRAFIKNTGLVTGGIVGGGLLGGVLGNQWLGTGAETASEDREGDEREQVNYSEARQFFLRQQDFDVLSTATERIFPEDDLGPGAIALGVPYFIDKQLAGPWGKNLDVYMVKPFQDGESPLNKGEIFLQGIRKMNKISNDNYGEAFPDLDEEQQIEILGSFENDEVTLNRVESSKFFSLLRQTTLEGVYSDPMHGGNKNMEGWRMKEFPGVQTSYRDMVEEDEFIVIEPISLSES